MDELQKKIRAIDLSIAAFRRRKSPRTGYVHFCYRERTASDTIPLFENFCFVLALFRQKTAEDVQEGKELLDSLLAFQLTDGNFPVYLHDYPKAWDSWMPLRIAPILVQILRHFRQVLQSEMRSKIEGAIEKCLQCIAPIQEQLPPVWLDRYVCLQNRGLHLSSHERYNPVSSDEWFQSLISSELVMTDPITPLVPFDRKLQLLIDDERPQEGFEVAPHPLEWVFGEEDGFSQRLLKDHPHQMYISSLFSRFGVAKTEQNSSLIQIFRKEGGLSLFWGGVQLHSLFVPSGKREGDFLTFDLVQPLDSSKEEREVLFFVDRSIETELFINGKKGTVFELGDLILIQTAEIEIEAVFTLVKGEGDFRGQISRGNRPSQISNTAERLYEAFDWMIALRSLRRTTPCQLRLALRCCHPHRVQSVVDVEHLSCDC